jgi:hypothetical protein
MQQGACTANNFGPSLEGVFLFFTLSVKSQYMRGTRLRMSLCISVATGVKKIPFVLHELQYIYHTSIPPEKLVSGGLLMYPIAMTSIEFLLRVLPVMEQELGDGAFATSALGLVAF